MLLWSSAQHTKVALGDRKRRIAELLQPNLNSQLYTALHCVTQKYLIVLLDDGEKGVDGRSTKASIFTDA